MEIYSTEEQQAEAIKRFFKENGISLALGVLVGFGGLYGWKSYNQNQIEQAEQASDAFSKVVSASQTQDGNVADADNTLKAEYGESNYAVLSAFVAAKAAVDAGNLEQAAEKLNYAYDNGATDELKAIALTRLARVQMAQAQYDDALASLDKAMPESFKATVAELKGDIFLAQGDKSAARSSYEAALEAGGLQGNPLLQVKLDDLAEQTPAA